jgi:hypothetical protein
LIDWGFTPDEFALDEINEKEVDESIVDGLEIKVVFKLTTTNEFASSFEIQLDEFLKKFPDVKKEKSM